ncbi:hypothetical protein MUO79_05620 [Candidatus Bathyarchaeota archaeon]|nr:hypothetical protein [Candidatus Bathyarchaeota archaeon]
MENDKATLEWLNSQTNAKTRENYAYAFPFFLKFMHKTGDELLEMRKADATYEVEKQALACKNWVTKQPYKTNPNKTYSDAHAKAVVTSARSFFAYYRMDLKFRRQEAVKLANAMPVQEKYKFMLDDFRRMFAVADLAEKYVLCVGKSFMLRAEDFVVRTRGDLEPYVNQEAPVCITQSGITTMKEHVPAFPFMDVDALPIIKLKLEQMTREGHVKPTDRMFTLHKRELTRTLKRLCEKAGINTGNKTVKFHCLRAFGSDKLASYMSESKWKQVVGKKIHESAYVSADELRKDFIRAMPDLTINKREQTGDIAQMAKLEALKAIAQTMGINTTDVFKMRKAVSMPEQISALENLVEKQGKSGFVKAGGLSYQQAQTQELAKFTADFIRGVKAELNKRE